MTILVCVFGCWCVCMCVEGGGGNRASENVCESCMHLYGGGRRKM